MRDMFRGYYQPTQEEVEAIWRTGLITLDTNILLSLYNVLPTTSALYLGAMEKRKPQMWLPYQIASEFHRNVHKERTKQTAGHAGRIGKIEGLLNDFRSTATKSRLQPSDLQEQAAASLSALREELDNERKQIAKQTHHHTRDELLDRIARVFDSGVGSKPEMAALEEMFKDGAKRFEQKIPPGYEDEKDKKDNRKYGDYVLWRQLLDHAADAKKDVIFVTDDNKADWWLKGDDKNKTTLAPRPELIQEFREETGKDIIILNSEQFYYALVPAANDNSAESAEVLAAQEDMKAAVSESQKVAALEVDREGVMDLMEALRRSLETKRGRKPDKVRPSDSLDWKLQKIYRDKLRADEPGVRARRQEELANANAAIEFLEDKSDELDFQVHTLPPNSEESDAAVMELDEVADRLREAQARKAHLESLSRWLDDGDAGD